MQSAGVRVKALKLELGKDLKLQASGIWMQLWDQNCDTYNTQLPTLGMERITKAQIVNYKHHQIERFLQDQVLISFFFPLESPHWLYSEFSPKQIPQKDTLRLPSWRW